jgi:UDP-glucose 4-epimerase
MTSPGSTRRRIVVVGATGNVGTALLRLLARDRPDWRVSGVARRMPRKGDPVYDRVGWTSCDISQESSAESLSSLFRSADAVVHCAWLLQPSRDHLLLERTNIGGSRRVFQVAKAESVAHVVYMSSVGAYSPGPKDSAVDESWPTEGVPTSVYSRHKSAVEKILDGIRRRPGAPTFAQLRPGLIFQRDAAGGVARLFLGPFVPTRLLGMQRLPLLPVPDAAVFQAVHADDVAEAIVRILDHGASGPYNVAAPPVMTPERLADVFRARRVRVSARLTRAAAELAYATNLQPTEPGWVDLALSAPVLATDRVEQELGWLPRFDARYTVGQLLDGMRRRAGTLSPALRPR